MNPWIGKVLKDTYRIDKLIGEGGAGLVFQGFHLRLKVAVAVKVLKQNTAAVAAARFRKEAEITARLRHPNVVQVLDYDITPDGHPYLVVEWLEGETVQAYLKRTGFLSAEEAVAILQPVCDAVAAAHAAGVVHRDLKPANLFLSQTTGGGGEPLVKVLDFGIAKLTEVDPVSTEQGQTLGTPRYMSPEQIKTEGEGDVGPQSDQFSLAVIAYELVTGQPAFPGSAHLAMLAVIAGECAPLPETVPAPYRLAVQRAMEQRPEARFPSVTAFLRALSGADAATQSPAPAAPAPLALAAPPLTPTTLPTASPPTLTRGPVPWAVWLGGAALIGALLGLLVYTIGLGPRRGGGDLDVRVEPVLRPLPGVPQVTPLSPSDVARAAPPADPPAPPPSAAAPPPAAEVLLRVKVAPARSTLYVDGRPQGGYSVTVPAGKPLRLRLVAPLEKRRCCPPRELTFTAAPQPKIQQKSIELNCDRDCPKF